MAEQEVKGNITKIKRPERWDSPFSLELPDVLEARLMTDVDIERVRKSPLFANLSVDTGKDSEIWKIIKNDARIRRYKEGAAVICEGDYGNSAFLVLNGACTAVINSLPPSMLNRETAPKKSYLQSLIGLFTIHDSPEEGTPDSFRVEKAQDKKVDEKQENEEFHFVQDIPIVLKKSLDGYKTDRMDAGCYFGELSALGRVKRAITILAAEEGTELLEIRWQGLRDIMLADDGFKASIDANFRKHGLRDTLWAFKQLGESKLDDALFYQLVDQATFRTYGSYDWYTEYNDRRKTNQISIEMEPVVVEQGQYFNGLILIRSGFARKSYNLGDGEITKAYLGKGEVYGLDEMLQTLKTGKNVPYKSTIRAAGYVDIVQISTRTFEQVIYPTLTESEKTNLEKKYKISETELNVSAGSDQSVKTIDPAVMEFFADNRYLNGTKTMLIDLERCTRCDDCVRACASGHSNNPRFIRHGKIHDKYMVANACMHCVDPVCMIGCPTGAINRKQDTGEIVINQKTCIGCGICASSCPYENIRMVNVRDTSRDNAVMLDLKGKAIEKATKCDLCSEHKGGPACERACPTDALKRIDMGNVEAVSQWLKR